MSPGQFDVSLTPDGYRVKRHFQIGSQNSMIDLDIAIKTNDKGGTTVDEMHRASVQAAIDYLQSLLTKASNPNP